MMRKLIYQKLKDCFVPPWWMACAYRDWATRQDVWVVWPLHYMVQCAWWLNLKWNKYRSKLSWIDKQVEARTGIRKRSLDPPLNHSTTQPLNSEQSEQP